MEKDKLMTAVFFMRLAHDEFDELCRIPDERLRRAYRGDVRYAFNQWDTFLNRESGCKQYTEIICEAVDFAQIDTTLVKEQLFNLLNCKGWKVEQADVCLFLVLALIGVAEDRLFAITQCKEKHICKIKEALRLYAPKLIAEKPFLEQMLNFNECADDDLAKLTIDCLQLIIDNTNNKAKQKENEKN